MGKFGNHKIYLIIPWADLDQNYTMLNKSLAYKFEDFRRSTDRTMALVSTVEPLHDVFLNYRVYSQEEIMEVLQTEAWAEGE